jgi:TatD DNase family protein
MNYALFDAHAHLHDKKYDNDREELIASMKSYGAGAITVGTDKEESRRAVELAEKHEHIFASVGLHPADNVIEEFDVDYFRDLAKSEKVVAIGECGLDYYYIETFFERDQEEKGLSWNKDAESDRQQRIFEEQIELAVELKLPLMLHGRPRKGSMDAYEDMLHILESAKKKHGSNLRGNAHFFVGSIDIAQRFIDIGFTMSFSGVITFTKDYDDVVQFIPATMIIAETDSPYATPAPFRGERNDPLKVQEIVARMAVLRNEDMETMRKQVLENVTRVFEIG